MNTTSAPADTAFGANKTVPGATDLNDDDKKRSAPETGQLTKKRCLYCGLPLSSSETYFILKFSHQSYCDMLGRVVSDELIH